MALCHEVTNDLETPVPHSPFDRYDSYPEMVAEMDRAVGRLIAALNALKLREKTLIIFVADNGTPQNLIVRAEGKELIKEPILAKNNTETSKNIRKELALTLKNQFNVSDN